MITTKKLIRSVKTTGKAVAKPRASPFDVDAFLGAEGVGRIVTKYARSALVFSQGEAASKVFYLQKGSVKLSVLSKRGKEAIVGILDQGHFFGEGCLAGQSRRMSSALALTASTVLVLDMPEMSETLHRQPALANRFLSHVLARNIRIEEDLVDQLFNSSEKRLARALLLLARYGTDDQLLLLPKISQETLAEMVGTTRSRVNFFMNKFRDLGFIEYNGTLTIHDSLLTVILHD